MSKQDKRRERSLEPKLQQGAAIRDKPRSAILAGVRWALPGVSRRSREQPQAACSPSALCCLRGSAAAPAETRGQWVPQAFGTAPAELPHSGGAASSLEPRAAGGEGKGSRAPPPQPPCQSCAGVLAWLHLASLFLGHLHTPVPPVAALLWSVWVPLLHLQVQV